MTAIPPGHAKAIPNGGQKIFARIGDGLYLAKRGHGKGWQMNLLRHKATAHNTQANGLGSALHHQLDPSIFHGQHAIRGKSDRMLSQRPLRVHLSGNPLPVEQMGFAPRAKTAGTTAVDGAPPEMLQSGVVPIQSLISQNRPC